MFKREVIEEIGACILFAGFFFLMIFAIAAMGDA